MLIVGTEFVGCASSIKNAVPRLFVHEDHESFRRPGGGYGGVASVNEIELRLRVAYEEDDLIVGLSYPLVGGVAVAVAKALHDLGEGDHLVPVIRVVLVVR